MTNEAENKNLKSKHSLVSEHIYGYLKIVWILHWALKPKAKICGHNSNLCPLCMWVKECVSEGASDVCE